MAAVAIFGLSLLALGAALPVEDKVIVKLDPVRYHYIQDADGVTHLSDSWLKISDLQEIARYTPSVDNQYHLFTRSNPSVSQPLVLNNNNILAASNYSPNRRTVLIIHGWRNSAISEINTVLVPAYLQAEDVNVIVVDWSSGASSLNYFTALANVVPSGQAVAAFVSWLNSASGCHPLNYHIIGHSLGGHQAGIVGRHLNSSPALVVALDPAYPGWILNSNRFKSTDGILTEVIHTNIGVLGYDSPLGDIDIYPNGGSGMVGCNGSSCDHSRSYYYMAESISSGGFTATQCDSYANAIVGNCAGSQLAMGGSFSSAIWKTGTSGIYYLSTNAAQPFSLG